MTFVVQQGDVNPHHDHPQNQDNYPPPPYRHEYDIETYNEQ